MEPNNQPGTNSNPLPTSPSPTVPPPPTPEDPKPEQSAKKSGALYALSALALVFSIGYATFTYLQQPQTTSSRADEPVTPSAEQLRVAEVQYAAILANAPENPTSVVATADDGAVTLTSGEPVDYDEVTFTWSGAKTVEPNTEIAGYYVYFGPNNTEIPYTQEGFEKSVNPKKDGVPLAGNTLTFKNLKKGETYYLYVQAVSNSTNSNPYYKFGLEKLGGLKTLAAKKLFTYIHK